MRTPIVAGNWKMHRTIAEAVELTRGVRRGVIDLKGVEVVLCPPFTALAAVREAIGPADIGLGAQNMYFEEQGAFTAEISPLMLSELCQYVILGHSERRTGRVAFPDQANEIEGCFESDVAVNRKVHAALAHGLTPIICVGENLDQREAGETEDYVSRQVAHALEGLSKEQVRRCIIAYEPIWAIGTGVAAQPVDVNRVIGLTIRGTVQSAFDEETAQTFRVQYGGSVNPKNIVEFLSMPEIDGALVGGASIKVDFVELLRKAEDL